MVNSVFSGRLPDWPNDSRTFSWLNDDFSVWAIGVASDLYREVCTVGGTSNEAWAQLKNFRPVCPRDVAHHKPNQGNNLRRGGNTR